MLYILYEACQSQSKHLVNQSHQWVYISYVCEYGCVCVCRYVYGYVYRFGTKG